MQLVPFQRGQRPDPPPIEFLVAFTRSLISMNPSGDALYLAMYSAMKTVNITEEQAKQFVAAVMTEKENAPWPKGFF